MKKLLLNKLKSGSLSFVEFHINLAKETQNKDACLAFKKLVLRALEKEKVCSYADIYSVSNFEWLLNDEEITAIITNKYGISFEQSTVLLSSSQFAELLLIHIRCANVQSTKGVLDTFVSNLWNVLNRVLNELNNFGNFSLLKKAPKLWFRVFEYVCDHVIDWERSRGIKMHNRFTCSFPFSQWVHFYLAHILTVCRSLGVIEKAEALITEVLNHIIPDHDSYAAHCLLEDIIQISGIFKDASSRYKFYKILPCERKLLVHCLKMLVLHSPLMKHIDTRFPHISADIIRQLLLCYEEKDTHSMLIKHLSPENFESNRLSECLNAMQLISLYFSPSNSDSYSSLLQFVDQVCDSDLFCYLSLLTIKENASQLKSNQEQSCIDQKKQLAVILTSKDSYKETVKDLSDQFNEIFSIHVDKLLAHNLFAATHELSINELVCILVGEAVLENNYSFDDLLSHCNERIEDDIFTSVIRRILRKRVVDDHPEELKRCLLESSITVRINLTSESYIKLLCVISLVRCYGLSVLEELKEKAAWILDNNSEISSSADLFNLLGEQYQSTRLAIYSADSAVKLDPVNIMLSYFQHKVGSVSGSSGTEGTCYWKCMRKNLEFEQVETLKILDSGTLFGSPLPSWGFNTCPLFLLYCYLSHRPSTNPVTKFLELLFRFPVRIQGIFVPTMRDDVITKFRETLGERFAAHGNHQYTWYKCAKGHIYAVNNCGEPQEKGKCFCGGQIGEGLEKHTLSQGNRKLEDYTFSEKGYNLPPITFLSSVDSERKLNSLPLSFLRWLIHSALAICPNISSCKSLFRLDNEEDVTPFLLQRIENDFKGMETSLGRNSEEVQIWLIKALEYIFGQNWQVTLDWSSRAHRDMLEEWYLDKITPLVDTADSIITLGKDKLYGPSDEYTRQVLGLSFPVEGPGLLDTAEFLKPSCSIHQLLERQFREVGSPRKLVVVNTYFRYRGSLDIIYKFPDFVKLLVGVLSAVRYRKTEQEVESMPVSELLTSSQIELWNTLWNRTRHLTHTIDTIYVPDTSSRQLTADTPLSHVLPSRTGPGVRSWFLLHHLSTLHNALSQGPVMQVTALHEFVTPPCIARHELVAACYSAYCEEGVKWELLEKHLSWLLNVKHRCIIEVKSLDTLLFQPRKPEDSWFNTIRQLGKVPPSNTQTYNLPPSSPALLVTLEVAIQISCQPDFKMLSLQQIIKLCDLNLPLNLKTESLYCAWHDVWFQLSLQNTTLFVPLESEKRISKAPSRLTSINSELLASLMKCENVLKYLHMMVVEWVAHNPGFDCGSWELAEAYDFFCEGAGLEVTEGVMELLQNTGLIVEDCVGLVNVMLSKVES